MPARAKAAGGRRRPAKPGAARKRMRRGRPSRGIEAADARLAGDDPGIEEAAARLLRCGGAVLGGYRDPLSGRPLVLAMMPVGAIAPTPFQRELSPTHAKRLAQKIEESGAFLDPLIAVAAPDGEGFWTPNGRHRLAAAQVLGLRCVTALVSPDEALAFRILALNTEKAHNLRDRSLEAIRMARALAARGVRRGREADRAAELESPALLTLGIVYERNRRFSGGAYQSLLKKLDRFDGSTSLAASLRRREGLAARLEAIDAEVTRAVKALQARGFRSPYLRTYVVARVNPVRWVRPKKGETDPVMPLGEALTRMARAVRQFDPAKVRESELAMVAAVAAADD